MTKNSQMQALVSANLHDSLPRSLPNAINVNTLERPPFPAAKPTGRTWTSSEHSPGRVLGPSRPPVPVCVLDFFFFLIFIELIGVTLVNKIIWVTSVQFDSTSSVYCNVCSPPNNRVSSHHHLLPLYPLLSPPHPFPLVITALLSMFFNV